MRFVAVLALVLFAGCTSGAGGSCTTNSDCNSGLSCQLTAADILNGMSGVCAVTDGGVGDLAPPAG
jgi:hypothetical protein